jgi:tRNA G18 (ribose-2'-O)-methylase SpoU
MKREIVLVIYNVRSAHNVGSLLRTADGLGIKRVFICGISPYPAHKEDSRLPHIAQKANRAIAKTSLGAEEAIAWSHHDDISALLKELSAEGFLTVALEQTDKAINMDKFNAPKKIAIIVGNEVEGIDRNTLDIAKIHLSIPMLGTKESFNVSVAGAMALYHLRYF